METKPAEDQQGEQEERRRLDAAARNEFPVIVDLNRRLEGVERKVERIRDLTVIIIGVGLGISVGQIVENLESSMSWGWPAALSCGLTILVVTFVLRALLK